MEEFKRKYESYKAYLLDNEKDLDEYLNLRDFMTWLDQGFVSH